MCHAVSKWLRIRNAAINKHYYNSFMGNVISLTCIEADRRCHIVVLGPNNYSFSNPLQRNISIVQKGLL